MGKVIGYVETSKNKSGEIMVIFSNGCVWFPFRKKRSGTRTFQDFNIFTVDIARELDAK